MASVTFTPISSKTGRGISTVTLFLSWPCLSLLVTFLYAAVRCFSAMSSAPCAIWAAVGCVAFCNGGLVALVAGVGPAAALGGVNGVLMMGMLVGGGGVRVNCLAGVKTPGVALLSFSAVFLVALALA